MPTGRITMYDNDGTPLTDLRASVTRSWVLNGVGQADFGIAYYDVKCVRRYLEYGNLVKIEHTDLPDWVGVISPPRQWQGNYLTVRAYEMGWLLKYRRTSASMKIGGTAGEMANRLLNIANEDYDTRIRAGRIYGGGTDRGETLGDSIYSHLDRVRERSGHEWYIYPSTEDGRLVGVMDWMLEAGKDVQAVMLTAKNTERGSYILNEDGEIINDLVGYGEANTEGSRIVSRDIDLVSSARYGRRQASKTFSGNREPATLRENVQAELAKRANPTTVFQAIVLNVGNIFRFLRLGNRLNVQISGVGFSDSGLGYRGTIRIVGMRYSDQKDRVELVTSQEPEEIT
jgi:hypothetical protein